MLQQCSREDAGPDQRGLEQPLARRRKASVLVSVCLLLAAVLGTAWATIGAASAHNKEAVVSSRAIRGALKQHGNLHREAIPLAVVSDSANSQESDGSLLMTLLTAYLIFAVTTTMIMLLVSPIYYQIRIGESERRVLKPDVHIPLEVQGRWVARIGVDWKMPVRSVLCLPCLIGETWFRNGWLESLCGSATCCTYWLVVMAQQLCCLIGGWIFCMPCLSVVLRTGKLCCVSKPTCCWMETLAARFSITGSDSTGFLSDCCCWFLCPCLMAVQEYQQVDQTLDIIFGDHRSPKTTARLATMGTRDLEMNERGSQGTLGEEYEPYKPGTRRGPKDLEQSDTTEEGAPAQEQFPDVVLLPDVVAGTTTNTTGDGTSSTSTQVESVRGSSSKARNKIGGLKS